MSSSRIAVLAAEIARNTIQVDTYFETNALPQPSFEIDGPVSPYSNLPEDIEEARKCAIESSIELQQLLQGVDSLLFPHTNMAPLQAIYRFQIASKFPVGTKISFVDLANLCDLHEHDLRRIVRYAIAHHRIFEEPERGILAHSAASKRLAENPMIQNIMGLTIEECWPAHARVTDALCEFKKSQEPNACGYALANNTTSPIFTYLGAHPSRAKRFAGAMSGTSPSGLAVLSQAYPWGDIPSGGIVVDVGGSQGHVSVHLAKDFPSLHFVVQDLPEVISTANATFEIPADVKDRVQLMAHDFFTEQPVKGADVYFIRYTLHNWSDEYCLKIFRNLIPALKTGARVVIHDHVLPEPGTLGLLKERDIRAMDMIMLTLQNAREREEGDWTQLFEQADERFELLSIRRTAKDSAAGIIVAEWKP